MENAKEGEGIYNGGMLTLINNSTVSGNAASRGGGIYVGSGRLMLTNSTLSDNTAAEGAGILNAFFGSTRITNSTVTGNAASPTLAVESSTTPAD